MEHLEKSIESLEKIRDACLSNAKDILQAAESVLESCKLPSVAYHLAALALEEVGKANLTVLKSNVTQIGHQEKWSRKWIEDHTRKLFWALWTPFGGKDKFTEETVESCRELARSIHTNRLQSLYVQIDSEVEGSTEPIRAITAQQATHLIKLTKTRLKMEPPGAKLKLSDSQRSNLEWFTETIEDTNERGFIFAKNSLDKMRDSNSVFEWISWLRDEKRKRDAKCQLLLENELARQEPEADKAMHQKWKIKIRLFTGSHSIRAATLNLWNRNDYSIKLHAITGKKGELLIEVTLPSIVPIQVLWLQGLTLARRFVVALNIGSSGFFWWELPKQTSRYCEEALDLETGASVGLEQSPKLEIDWKRGVLDEDDLYRISVAFGVLPGPSEEHLFEPFNHYLTGLTYLSKSDVHMSFEHPAFMEFYESLKTGMTAYCDWDGKSEFVDIFHETTREFMRGKEDRDRIIDIGENGTSGRSRKTNTNLKDAGVMKQICDAYFNRVFHRELERRAQNSG